MNGTDLQREQIAALEQSGPDVQAEPLQNPRMTPWQYQQEMQQAVSDLMAPAARLIGGTSRDVVDAVERLRASRDPESLDLLGALNSSDPERSAYALQLIALRDKSMRQAEQLTQQQEITRKVESQRRLIAGMDYHGPAPGEGIKALSQREYAEALQDLRKRNVWDGMDYSHPEVVKLVRGVRAGALATGYSKATSAETLWEALQNPQQTNGPQGGYI